MATCTNAFKLNYMDVDTLLGTEYSPSTSYVLETTEISTTVFDGKVMVFGDITTVVPEVGANGYPPFLEVTITAGLDKIKAASATTTGNGFKSDAKALGGTNAATPSITPAPTTSASLRAGTASSTTAQATGGSSRLAILGKWQIGGLISLMASLGGSNMFLCSLLLLSLAPVSLAEEFASLSQTVGPATITETFTAVPSESAVIVVVTSTSFPVQSATNQMTEDASPLVTRASFSITTPVQTTVSFPFPDSPYYSDQDAGDDLVGLFLGSVIGVVSKLRKSIL